MHPFVLLPHIFHHTKASFIKTTYQKWEILLNNLKCTRKMELSSSCKLRYGRLVGSTFKPFFVVYFFSCHLSLYCLLYFLIGLRLFCFRFANYGFWPPALSQCRQNIVATLNDVFSLSSSFSSDPEKVWCEKQLGVIF